MAKRPRQHRIGDEAETQFAAILPTEWVFRREDKDYGIDGAVEIFNEDDSHTGLRFHVQLKGTDSTNSIYQHTVRFDETALDYWHSQELPTLLVRYCSEGKKIYFAWYFDRRIKPSKDGRKASIRLTEADRWEETTPAALRLSLEKITRLRNNGLSHKPALRFEDVENPEARRLQRRLREPMGAYRSLVGFGDRRPELIGLGIMAERDGLLVSLEGIATAMVPVEEDSEILAANLLVACAFCLLAVGQTSLGIRMMKEVHNRAELHQNDDVANLVTRRLIQQEEYHLLGEVARSLWMRGLNQFGTEMFVFYPLFEFEEMSAAQRTTTLECMLEYLGHHIRSGSDQAGRIAYNIGEALLLRGENRIAIHMFRKACELDPDYVTRPYLYVSAGGALFKERRFKAAAWCYCRSLRLSEAKEPTTMALLADAQLQRGRIGSSVFWLEKALAYETLHQDPRAPKFLLLHYAAKTLRESGEQARVVRRRLDAEAMVYHEIKNQTQRIAEAANEAINIDPISPYIWHAIAVERSKLGENEEAIVPHILSATLSDSDPGYWLDLLLAGITSGVDQSTLVLWMAAAYATGFHFLSEVILDRLSKVKDEQTIEFLERLSEAFAAMPVVERPRIMRAVTAVNAAGDNSSIPSNG